MPLPTTLLNSNLGCWNSIRAGGQNFSTLQHCNQKYLSDARSILIGLEERNIRIWFQLWDLRLLMNCVACAKGQQGREEQLAPCFGHWVRIRSAEGHSAAGKKYSFRL